jgi:predicted aminopeptidase
MLVALLITGCQTCSYYGQAVRGQFQIVNRQRSIKEVLTDPRTATELSNRLDLVLNLRAFAERALKLPANGHYLNYADLGRRFAVWNVYAAPEFSLEAKAWWYPVVGNLKYRGYFEEAAARRYGTNLASHGMDVFVGGVEAYSTLGWFHDPVLNTFVFNQQADLAETLFHELAHQRVFVSGDTDFNEAFATAVGEEGVRRWMRAQSNAVAFAAYEAETRRKEQVIRLLADTRERLRRIYGESESGGPESSEMSGGSSLSDADKRRLKAEAFEELQRDYKAFRATWGGSEEWDGWFRRPLNNAHLSTVDTYYKLVPAFHELLRASGGDLEKYYGNVRRIGKLKKQERERLLRSYLPALTEGISRKPE